MTYPDIRMWLFASQGGCKLFQTGIIWLISSDNSADGTCAMLVITLGGIFGAKTQNVRENAFTKFEAFTVLFFQLPNPSLQKQKCCFLIPRRSVTLGFWSWQQLQSRITDRKTNQVAAYWPAHIRGQPQHGVDTSETNGPLLPQILRLQLRERSDLLQMSGFNLPPHLWLRELRFQGKCAVSCPKRVEGYWGGPQRWRRREELLSRCFLLRANAFLQRFGPLQLTQKGRS